MVSQKPTISTANVASLRAVREGADYVIAPVLGERGVWSVRKQGAVQSYRVSVLGATCSCPHFQQRLAGSSRPCKHLEMVRIKSALITPPLSHQQNEVREERMRLESRDERIRRDFGPDCC